jgi:hypothetical protein
MPPTMIVMRVRLLDVAGCEGRATAAVALSNAIAVTASATTSVVRARLFRFMPIPPS